MSGVGGASSVCLVVLDGWGLAAPGPGNAVSLARTPVFDALWERYPHTTLTAGGAAVGLPDGQMGNSEVGHLNLGAGAVVKQDLTLIDEAAKLEAFGGNEVLLAALQGAPRVHLLGLVSDGGVHSSIEHVHGLLQMAAHAGVVDLVIHAFTDGRDTLPAAGSEFLGTVERWCAEIGVGRIASVVGRYFAMDRDGRWERVQAAYDLLVHGIAEHTAQTGRAALLAAYDRGETDEFVSATRVGVEGAIRPRDSVIAFNFRPDRMREISCALADRLCPAIDRRGARPVARYTTLTEYGGDHADRPVAFRPARPSVTLPRVVAARGGLQLHVAETEKYPHVTYFFGGGKERPEEGERRELVPSPRDVATYDLKPAMSAPGCTESFVRAWHDEDFLFAIINFANPDMVGHTGVIPAAIEAIETVDACLARIVEAVHSTGGVCIVTADHGNADHMLEPDGSPNTAHSLNPVPLIVTREGVRLDPAPGILADVAPTALALLGIPQPPEMTGRSLLAPSRAAA
ncbi:MAG: 2,3-bisphosphoglycerate-independent phosphoglycerate mutase [uncultured Solirubrobacteraceae bacterium]|uniref:2,3-bisphosphoglycerate-independent phosphoglycerate mutase n=1 Tax=uncultured Solirubrobacteraceae bacterium TaxID=1162706 RepID=A0A6J4SBC8_9ACTN|nr:MAG: 2,3-bisphosphoglycerate-independent phosphoglycerate mutase [uncultured Solirubrobacteraceae bacterium]